MHMRLFGPALLFVTLGYCQFLFFLPFPGMILGLWDDACEGAGLGTFGKPPAFGSLVAGHIDCTGCSLSDQHILSPINPK